MDAEAPARIRAWLEARREAMAALLLDLVEAESPTLEPESQRVPQGLLADRLQALGLHTRLVPGRVAGGALLARPDRAGRAGPAQLLIGHSDTVWPRGSVREMPPHVTDGRLYGPGAFDMKGGLVEIVFALEALRELGLPPAVPPCVLVTSDEEIGSPESFRLIRRLARCADRAFVLEPALGPAGRLKTARKGHGQFRLEVRGRAAHAGLEPEKGASAILELSHQVQRLFALNDPERGITVNVGTIDGGLRPNVVAPAGFATVDVRILNAADAPRVEAALHGLTASTPGTTLHIEGKIERLPMERTPGNRRLWQRARSAAYELGLEIDEGTSGGGSDGNITSLFCPTLDGLGPVGDGAHAMHENVVLESLPERAALLALLILSPPMTTRRDGATRAAAAEAPVAAPGTATPRLLGRGGPDGPGPESTSG
ncbi:MAG: M20 family metallopeptidase [Gemmatimonadota bacterium]|nr:M20 family metallopeptidase [Gemmatimonadota bacterium]